MYFFLLHFDKTNTGAKQKKKQTAKRSPSETSGTPAGGTQRSSREGSRISNFSPHSGNCSTRETISSEPKDGGGPNSRKHVCSLGEQRPFQNEKMPPPYKKLKRPRREGLRPQQDERARLEVHLLRGQGQTSCRGLSFSTAETPLCTHPAPRSPPGCPAPPTFHDLPTQPEAPTRHHKWLRTHGGFPLTS